MSTGEAVTPIVSQILWSVAVGPVLLILTALLPARRTAAAARARSLLARAAAACTVVTALGAALAVALSGALRTVCYGVQGIGISLYLDALSATMFCLVSFIGLIVVIFSHQYLDGEPGQIHFVRRLCMTLAAVLFVIIAGNLALFAGAWIATSVALHRLLVFYPDRQAAVLAARKKYLASRIGEACLLVAMAIIFRRFGTLDYGDLFVAAGGPNGLITGAVHAGPMQAAALLLVVTALLKSAQLPLHGWILEVMETPTPVSALLHAGIVNAGGFLILRFAPIVAASIPALDTLAVIGGLTALFGSIVLLPQTSIKVSLAYSTIAQMGFMMLECGLGAFSAALLHILAHSLYKAHAFLASGSVIDIARASWTPSPGGQPHPARMAISIVAVALVTIAVSPLFGASLTEKPGLFALGFVVLLGLIHLIANGIDERPNGYVIGRTVALALLVAVSYYSLQWLMERLTLGCLPRTQILRGPFELGIVLMTMISFGAVTLFQSILPRQARMNRWQALYAHVLNGFYLNTLANRWVLKFWPTPPQGNALQPYPLNLMPRNRS
jgi:NAD(P)H-quinone oxidoreductase subunit 5